MKAHGNKDAPGLRESRCGKGAAFLVQNQPGTAVHVNHHRQTGGRAGPGRPVDVQAFSSVITPAHISLTGQTGGSLTELRTTRQNAGKVWAGKLVVVLGIQLGLAELGKNWLGQNPPSK